jgi:hypothetical protein
VVVLHVEKGFISSCLSNRADKIGCSELIMGKVWEGGEQRERRNFASQVPAYSEVHGCIDFHEM